jgi:sugar phosphate isomerase/epimerase
MKSALTVSLVPEAVGGPFVFWNGLHDAFTMASELGFDGVEIFAPEPAALATEEVRTLREQFPVAVAAVGTGAGWVKHKLHLCHPDKSIRRRALDFILEMVLAGGALDAPAILGSMQGRVEPGVEREQALGWLAEGLAAADAAAGSVGTVFLYEPLNRYETNLFNRQMDAAGYLEERGFNNTRILADLFHMNIEESDLPSVLRGLGARLGHVHFADSNRRAMGFGHTDPVPVVEALRQIGYVGYLSAEVLPLPSPEAAAGQTILSFRKSVQ